jgi:hypothetical protein
LGPENERKDGCPDKEEGDASETEGAGDDEYNGTNSVLDLLRQYSIRCSMYIKIIAPRPIASEGQTVSCQKCCTIQIQVLIMLNTPPSRGGFIPSQCFN